MHVVHSVNVTAWNSDQHEGHSRVADRFSPTQSQ